MQRIGIFGGTFNPPHIGHVNIISAFIKEYELSEVLVIPTYAPPHKISPDLASPEDRMEMCRRTFKDMKVTVSNIEIMRKGKSYTYDTLQELGGMYKDAEFYFLVGEDMIMSLHTWHNAPGILKMSTIVSAARTNEFTEKMMTDYLNAKYPREYQDGRFAFLNTKPITVSSTQIRGKIANRESICGLVTPETEEYIYSRGIYNARA